MVNIEYPFRSISLSSLFSRALTDRRFLAANAVAIASLALLVFFPREGVGELLLLEIFSYLVLPFVFIQIILREPLASYGFSWGNRGALFSGGLVVCATGIFVALLWGLSLQGERFLPSLPSVVSAKFGAFLGYVFLSAVSNGVACLFFQGFLLSTWRRRFGWQSILFVTIFFLFFLFTKNDFAFDVVMMFFVSWSLVASGVAFVSQSALVAFCFFFLSDILSTAFLVFRS